MCVVSPLSWLSLFIGQWLFVSQFSWAHSAAQAANTAIVAIVYTSVAVASVGFPRMRSALVFVAAWLLISAFALPRENDATLWNNAAVALAMLAIALRAARVRTSQV